MNAYVGTIRADSVCNDLCKPTGPSPFCSEHKAVTGFRWAINTADGVKRGEAPTSAAAWDAVRAAA